MRGLACASGTLAILLLLSGCADPPRPRSIDAPVKGATHILQDTLEAAGLEAPTFQLTTLVPLLVGGEPSVWAGLQGELLVSFPGCERDNRADAPTLLLDPCQSGPVYRSLDQGTTWDRLNAEDGSLGKHPRANSDAEVASDANGTVYAANLGNDMIPVDRLKPGDSKWKFVENVVPKGHWADRQWLAAGAPGHVGVTWMGGDGNARQVAVTVSEDYGEKWTDVEYLGDGIGWLGPLVYEPNGTKLFIPFTQPSGGGPTAPKYDLMLAVGSENGTSWDVTEAGVSVTMTATSQQWSGTFMAPALDVTGDGHLVYAWSEPVAGPAGAVENGAVVKFITSHDDGKKWSEARVVNEGAAAIMPWVAAGAGDRFAIAYYESSIPLDHNYVGRWNVVAAAVDGAGSADPKVVRSTIEADVHTGGICTRGGGCLVGMSDRTFLDFFEADITSDGNLFLAYPKDTLPSIPNAVGLNAVELRVAIQNGGTPFLVRASPQA